MYESHVKSLYQASKKAKNDLIRETNKYKQKQEAESKKQMKKSEKAEHKKLMEIAIPEDEMPVDGDHLALVASEWRIFGDATQHPYCTDLQLVEAGKLKTELDHSRCIQVFEANPKPLQSDVIHQGVTEIRQAMQEQNADPCDSAAMRALGRSLDFPDFEEMLTPEALDCVHDFSWALKGYLKQPHNRVPALDKSLDLKEDCSSPSSYYSVDLPVRVFNAFTQVRIRLKFELTSGFSFAFESYSIFNILQILI